LLANEIQALQKEPDIAGGLFVTWDVADDGDGGIEAPSNSNTEKCLKPSNRRQIAKPRFWAVLLQVGDGVEIKNCVEYRKQCMRWGESGLVIGTYCVGGFWGLGIPNV
jgi:hypothetical protein